MHKLATALTLVLTSGFLYAQESDPVIESLEAYFDFAEYGGATISAEQIPAGDWENFFVIDARDAAQFEKTHIPGAVNIEWRQLLSRRDELPRDQPILVYCNTGSLSSQAGFALRVAGYDNLRILQGGIESWQHKGGFDAYRRATAPTAESQ
ncbi:MAG: rhodanese-like domain-containing protein [Candidatus Thiodiazotropha sp.]